MVRILLVFLSIWAMSSAEAVGGRRAFFLGCLKSMLNPAGALVSIVDLRAEFAGLVTEISTQFPHVNVLRLGGSAFVHPWNIQMESLADQPEPNGATVNMYALAKNSGGEIVFRPLIKKNDGETVAHSGLHIILDSGSGSMANIQGFAQGLHRAQSLLVKGGLLAIHFPSQKKPLEEFAASAVEALHATFDGDLLSMGLRHRYERVRAGRLLSFLKLEGSIRFDGCFVKGLDGRFYQLGDWIERRFPDFEVVRPLFASFNQLLLRRKEDTSRRSDFSLQYVGSFGNERSVLPQAAPFHFFDELALQPGYVEPPLANLNDFSRWVNSIAELQIFDRRLVRQPYHPPVVITPEIVPAPAAVGSDESAPASLQEAPLPALPEPLPTNADLPIENDAPRPAVDPPLSEEPTSSDTPRPSNTSELDDPAPALPPVEPLPPPDISDQK